MQVTIDLADSLKPGDDGLSEQAYVTGSFSYGDEDEETGGPHHHLVYLKLTVPAGAPLDVITYQQNHRTFPTDSTLQQLYDDQEFEAYRELGYHCAQAALRHVRYGSADQADDDAAAGEPRLSSH